MNSRYTIGLDISTQSISAVVVEPGASPARVVAEVSLRYAVDSRLNRFGIDFDTLLVPPRVAGEADQPPEMFLAGLDAVFSDLVAGGTDLSHVAAISVSAQQHGHVYLNGDGLAAIASLNEGAFDSSVDLLRRFRGGFSYGTAPIWQTADSKDAADEIRAALGGTPGVVEESGSDSPSRFTGAVIRRTAKRYGEAWRKTERVELLSSFFSAILSGNPDCPIDWGNGAGMTLMDYRNRRWSDRLTAAVGEGLPDGGAGVRSRLPELASPVDLAGTIARYFVDRYRFSPECLINVGSGDNPQSKVMIDGDLLSLGSSFVYMVDTGEPVVDAQGFANSMYDGIGRPFVFACRTNGAMVWDRVRGLTDADFDRAEGALAAAQPGQTIAVWQPYSESYPVAPPIDFAPTGSKEISFEELYPAVVDSALVLIRHYAVGFERGSGPLALTGGPANSPAIQQRVAAVFERPVVVMGSSGAGLGSALSAWATLRNQEEANGIDPSELSRIRGELVPPERTVQPDRGLVAAYRNSASQIVEVFETAARAAAP